VVAARKSYYQVTVAFFARLVPSRSRKKKQKAVITYKPKQTNTKCRPEVI
jgi:hypothetical protein